jgi:exodeoxyribonuclease V gamma subunit
MSDLNVFFSNRLEILAEKLAQRIRVPLSSALTPEIIVVQSRGMERWVSMELAKHNGIWANSSFPFPNAFLQDMFNRFIPDLPEPSPWDPDIMSFGIMKLLPACLKQTGFETINAYLENDTNHLKLYQLSDKLADLFDQYLVFRPDLVFSWEENAATHDPDEFWQAQLWRKLVAMNGPMHRARLRKIVFDRFADGSADISCLPQRISVFGISYLPPFHLEAFTALSNFLPVNFFLLNPCKEYWTDIVSERQHQKIRRKFPDTEDISADLHVEEGNRLLASMGNLGKDFFQLLGNFDVEFHEFFDDAPCSDMLSCIQSDILNLRNRRPAEAHLQTKTGPSFGSYPEEPVQLRNRDTSIQVHSCHSPMREIEVLHDNLLAMFEEDPALLPKEIIGMAPDIETYTPYIHAVFDAQTNDARRIPFSIADQTARKESRLIDGFLGLMDLKDSRITPTQILRLLEYPSIRQTFGFSDDDIQVFERWIRDTQIRWGRDVNDRLKLDLPRFAENTWRSGINRLLLGYAMPGYHRDMFEEILPYDDIEGNDSNMLGNMVEFLDRIFRCVNILEHPKTLRRWKDGLHFILEQFFLSDDDTEIDIQTLRQLFDNLADRQIQSDLDEKLDANVIRSYLCSRLDEISFSTGFMSRGVTFCAMLPMRSIPFKVICLVGLDADAFPRDIRPLSFDFMARYPKIGDRSRRNDDKYIFLESILCARKTLYISYVGQSVQDNSRIPSSVLVSEMLNEVEASFFLPDKSTREHVVANHRLQAFSPFYFQGDSKFFSYSEENMLASGKRQNNKDPQSFITKKLDMSAEEIAEWKNIDIDMLCMFFSNPTRFLLEKRLGIFLGQLAAMTEERENFELSALERYAIEQNLINSRLTGMELDDFRPIQRALGQLPPGHVGDYLYNEMSLDADSFFDRVKNYTRDKIEAPLDVDLEISGFRLNGRLKDIYEPGYVHLRYANRKAKDLLNLWIYHLIYCELGPENRPAESFLICKDRIEKFNKPSNPGKILKALLEIFRQGLKQPIHFFPETSLEYIQQIEKKPDNLQRARGIAKNRWIGNEYKRGDIEDPYYYRCFKNADPIDKAFEQIAKHIYLPLLAHSMPVAVRKI